MPVEQTITTNIDCIITAAGLSRRAGTWKMVLPFMQKTILDTCIDNALFFCRRVILVTGHRGDELHRRYAGQPHIHLVHNENYRRGMFSSIKAGLMQAQGEHVFLCHGDMPCIPPVIYRDLWLNRGDYTLIPSYQHRCGHPVLLPASVIAKALAESDDGQLRHIIRDGAVRYHEVDTDGVLDDIDTLTDYYALKNAQQTHNNTVFV